MWYRVRVPDHNDIHFSVLDAETHARITMILNKDHWRRPVRLCGFDEHITEHFFYLLELFLTGLTVNSVRVFVDCPGIRYQVNAMLSGIRNAKLYRSHCTVRHEHTENFLSLRLIFDTNMDFFFPVYHYFFAFMVFCFLSLLPHFNLMVQNLTFIYFPVFIFGLFFALSGFFFATVPNWFARFIMMISKVPLT